VSAFGLSAHQINRRTRIKRATVDAALAVASSELAKKATQRYDFLSLDQATAVAEFENDEAVKELVVAAKNGMFDHTLQRLRDDRADREAQDAVLAELEEAGVTVIDRPGWGDSVRHLASLSTDDNPLTVETHASCPGHAAYVAEVWSGDDDDEHDEAAELIWEPVYVCTDPVANGHIEPRQMRPARTSETPEANDEAKRQERRTVIANNKAWRSAQSVRREWLSKFLERKTAPKDAQRFIYAAFAYGDAGVTKAMESGHKFAAGLLGIELGTNTYGIDRTPILGALADASDSWAVVIALGLVLCAYEDDTHTGSWRHPSPSTARYLQAIEGWGYGLSAVEQLAAGRDIEADKAEA
jgi:ParB family transcriptional regulator, chromosome partitioning protein